MCKVCQVVNGYDVGDVEAEFAVQYETDEVSLRGFADRLNAALIESALDSINEVLHGDPLILYRTLTDASVDGEYQAQTKDALVYAGVDVAELQDDFVSHMTVRKHLRECRELETGQSDTPTVDGVQSKIEYSLDYATRTIRQVLTGLEDSGKIASGDLDVTVTARLICTECNTTYRVAELLEHRGCDCSNERAATPS